LALAALFGLAIGARYGLISMSVHAVGVPLGLGAAAALSAPSLCIANAHFNLPIDARQVAVAMARAVERCGNALAGLAPAALLLTVTPESALSAALFASAGLLLGGALGARELFSGLGSSGRRAPALLSCALLLFGALVATRVWWLVLPVLGRAALMGVLP
jgi:hypothetical protein